MGFATHLGPIRFGTVKDNSANNCGIPTLNQVATFAPGQTSPRTIATLPAGSQILSITASVAVAFDGTANTLDIGTAASPAFFATGVDLGVAGNTDVTLVTANLPSMINVGPADVPVIGTFAGTDATAGSAYVTITYLLKNPNGTVTAAS